MSCVFLAMPRVPLEVMLETTTMILIHAKANCVVIFTSTSVPSSVRFRRINLQVTLLAFQLGLLAQRQTKEKDEEDILLCVASWANRPIHSRRPLGRRLPKQW